MRAIEDLLNEVRDARSREHLTEAVRAYQAGALRAAIISTWVAVALDLTAKIRELAEMGEAAAGEYVKTLDNAIARNDIAQLGKLEHTLLDVCRDTFEFIGAREHEELARLHADRHVCAHPAFVSPDVVFSPTAEACRAHIAVAVDAVLSQGPTPGRKAVERFVQEARGAAWPMSVEALAEHLRARYIERGKEALRRNLAQVIVKGCVNAPDGDERLRSRMIEAAHALDAVSPLLLESAMRDVVTRREETSGLGDDELLNLIGGLGDLDATWRALPETSHPRAAAIVATAPLDDLVRANVVKTDVLNGDVVTALRERLAKLDQATLQSVVERQPSRALVPFAIAELADSGSWRGAEERMTSLILPLAAHLDTDDVTAVHNILRENGQVREASGIPPMIETLFEQTRDLPGALVAWREISDWLRTQGRNGDPNDWYAYPGLATRVAAATGQARDNLVLTSEFVPA